MLLFKSKSVSGSRRLASKSPVEQVTVCKDAAPIVLTHEWTINEASAETREEVETREEPNPVQSLAPNPVESFVTSVLSEAADMVDYIKTIILTDDNKKSGMGNTRALQPASKISKIVKATESPSGKGEASALQPASKVVKVKGSPFTLSRLIKTLDNQEREVEKLQKQLDEAEQEVMGAKKERKMKKLEQQLIKADQKVKDTRSRIKALADKFELRGILDDKGFDERLEEVLADGVKVVSSAREEVLYFTKKLVSTIEDTAREALFPDETEYGTEYGSEYGTEYGSEDESESERENENQSENQKAKNQSENQSKDRVEDSVNPKNLSICVEVEAGNGMF